MTRMMLCGIVIVSSLLGSPAKSHANDAEEKAVAFVQKLGGTVMAL